ncbi:hypothetical protein Bbelb_170880 [Branchiostoma belcheri]|nr:hypothetical protein Bbelb_170880 [Branchiostoma belcheri]
MSMTKDISVLSTTRPAQGRQPESLKGSDCERQALSAQNPSVNLGGQKKGKLGRALADVDSDSPLFVDALGDQGRKYGRTCFGFFAQLRQRVFMAADLHSVWGLCVFKVHSTV